MLEMSRKQQRSARSVLALAMFVLTACLAATSGCGGAKEGKEPDRQTEPGGSNKIRVCYLGLTCEPPIFVAYEKGFFKEEGLDVELVKTDWRGMREGLDRGDFHATFSFIMYLIKPIELGQDLKLTGGIHHGCLHVQAGTKTDIQKVADLKGKKVGITHLGSPPFFFASRVLADANIDPKKDVEWVTMPPDAMSKAIDEGMVDAVASAEPIGTLLMGTKKVRSVCDQARNAPYDGEYCCTIAVNGKFARDNPAAAAKVTRALFKGARWVQVNPSAAAKLAVEKGYVAASMEVTAQAISKLMYDPGVAKARRDIRTTALHMKNAGFLKKDTDPEQLARNAWLDLDGVSDDWVKDLKIERVAGGGRPPRLSPADFVALFDRGLCCRGGACLGCCGDSGEPALPLSEEWTLVRPTRLEFGVNRDEGLHLVEARR
jgi:NitT/TauT family transport system substrate-binding protein